MDGLNIEHINNLLPEIRGIMSNSFSEFLNLAVTGGVGVLLIIGLTRPPAKPLTKEEILQKRLKRSGAVIISLQDQNASLSATMGAMERKHQREIAELHQHYANEINRLQKQATSPFSDKAVGKMAKSKH